MLWGYKNVFIHSNNQCFQPEVPPVLMRLKAKLPKHHDRFLNGQVQNYLKTFPSKSKSFNWLYISSSAPDIMWIMGSRFIIQFNKLSSPQTLWVWFRVFQSSRNCYSSFSWQRLIENGGAARVGIYIIKATAIYSWCHNQTSVSQASLWIQRKWNSGI